MDAASALAALDCGAVVSMSMMKILDRLEKIGSIEEWSFYRKSLWMISALYRGAGSAGADTESARTVRPGSAAPVSFMSGLSMGDLSRAERSRRRLGPSGGGGPRAGSARSRPADDGGSDPRVRRLGPGLTL